jgi:hydrogenase/urease accessory protein HupE
MTRLGMAGFVTVLLSAAARADAHPVPFSYLDFNVRAHAITTTLVVHVFDVAHDLGIEPPERLLERDVLATQAPAIVELIRGRVRVASNGRTLISDGWSAPEPLADRQSLRLRSEFRVVDPTGSVTVSAHMFPYDPQHQSFLNFYEADALTTQAILAHGRTRFEYFTGTRQGTLAVVQKFVPAGVHHILVGPDHILFLIGLLLLGGSIRRLLIVVTAFTFAHSISLSLTALNLMSPPAQLVEPVIALSIVYVGADNLMVRGGQDVRAWIAFAFGFIHGFGFASVLREMDLPARDLGWALLSFNLGVEIGQLFVVAMVASLVGALRTWSEQAGRRLALAGSVVVIAAGTFWFIERVFFPGGMT